VAVVTCNFISHSIRSNKRSITQPLDVECVTDIYWHLNI
jgi:hypothetical protein